jgi:rod shape-determining protein MreB and related proteins
VDLGTANTLVYQAGRGVVFDEPTVVAVNGRTGEVVAVGRAAFEMVEGSGGKVGIQRPRRRGAVTEFDLARQMLRMILRSLGIARFAKPRVLVAVPSSLTPVERRAVQDAVSMAGAKSVSLVDEPLAAAVGAGLPIHQPVGNLVVDVGGGTTEVAVVAMGGVVLGRSLGVGGFDLDAAIQAFVRAQYGVAIGDGAAERLKIELGSAYPAADARPGEVKGRDMSSGGPVIVTLTQEEIREAMAGPVGSLVGATRDVLAESPPDLAQDVLETGLFLTGGGALLRGLDMRLALECEVPVHRTEHPLATVVLGAGHLLEYLPDYQSGLLATRPGA